MFAQRFCTPDALNTFTLLFWVYDRQSTEDTKKGGGTQIRHRERERERGMMTGYGNRKTTCKLHPVILEVNVNIPLLVNSMKNKAVLPHTYVYM